MNQEQLGAETLRGCLILIRPACRAGRWGQAEADRDSVVSPAGRKFRREARERRSGEIPIKASVSSPGRGKPKGATSGRRTKHTSGRQGLSEGSKPRNRSLSSRPLHFGARVYRWVNGMWVLPSRKRLVTFREGNAPKGESQERCRCETKPARFRRE
jgi:hypothetical protein